MGAGDAVAGGEHDDGEGEGGDVEQGYMQLDIRSPRETIEP
jgi:hypothetical protein